MRTIQNAKVACVGGAGFLGSHLVDHLIDDRQCDVLVVDNLVAGRRDFVHPKARFEHHDITGSEDYLRRLFEHYQIKYVFNYAAYPYVPDSFKRPLRVFDVNATGAIKVINAAHEAGCKGILQISSAELYGAGTLGGRERQDDAIPQDLMLDENAPVAPHSTYGAAKAAVDSYCQVAWKERQVPVVALRQFNCIGQRDSNHPYVIPEIMRQLNSTLEYGEGHGHNPANGSPTVFLGNNSFRDFLYAGDQAIMAAELLEKGEFGEVYNLGSEEGVKIYDLAEMIGRLMGFACVKIETDPERVRPWEIWSLLSDNSKIYSVIESRPTVNLEQALRRTLEYFERTNWRFSW